MKKVTVAATMIIASAFIAHAEESGDAAKTREAMMRRPPVQAMMATSTRPAMKAEMKEMVQAGMAIPMTGDAATDAQLKTLATEMEVKIKAIRDEYQMKIKALVGDKKPMMASTSPAMKRTEGAEGERKEKEKNGGENRMMRPTAMPPREREGEFEGVMTEENGAAPLMQGGAVQGKVQSFFRGLFGR